MEETKRKFKITKPYTIVVGNYRYHRNYRRIVEAFKDLKKEKDVQLVICGSVEDGRNIFRGAEDVIVAGSISDEDLKALYSGAVFLTHVTLMEGFGMTALEAMKCGCAVLSSNSCSLPEICGDAAYYVNPESVKEIREGMKRLFEDQELRRELILKGYKNVQKYSPKKFVGEIVNIILNL